MKNIFKVVGAIVFIAIIGLSTVACNKGGASGLGETLTINEQVYTEKIDFGAKGITYSYAPYDGADITVKSNTGATGTISDGKLKISVGTPDSGILQTGNKSLSIEDVNSSGITIDPPDAKGIALSLPGLRKGYSEMDSSMSMTIEYVMYVYFDRAVTIKGKVSTDNSGSAFSDINLSMKKGWNAMNFKMTASQSGGTVSLNNGDIARCVWTIDK